jgi:hypothetical protein
MNFFANQDNLESSFLPDPHSIGQVAQIFIQDIPTKKQKGIEGLVLC